MSNRHKGEVDFKVGDKTYTLVLDANRIVEVETLLDSSIGDLDMRRVGTQRALLWAALQQHHPGLSLIDAGQLMTGGGMSRIGEAISEVLSRAFPPEEPDALPNPRTAAQDGTGTPS